MAPDYFGEPSGTTTQRERPWTWRGQSRGVSVANLTRNDANSFFQFVRRHPLDIPIRRYPLHQANEALDDLRRGRLEGAAVLDLALPIGTPG